MLIRVMSYIILGIVLIIFGYSGYLFYVNTHLPLNLEDIPPSRFNIKYEDVDIITADNVRLKGWFIPAEISQQNNSRLPAIIICHGLGTNKSDLIELAVHLHNTGYHILMFDFRGHGFSGAVKTSLGYKEQIDLKTAVSYVSGRDEVDKERIGVFGLSMGAAAAILTAAKDKRIKAVVSDSSYISLWDQAERDIKNSYHLPPFPLLNFAAFFYRIVFSESMSKISPVNVVGDISPAAILFIAGEMDERMTARDAKMLYHKAGNPKEFFTVAGAAHGENLSKGGQLYKNKISDFFDRYL